MKTDIAAIRQEYLMASLRKSDLDQNPIQQFQIWFQDALNASIEHVNAMTLSTVDQNKHPKSRIVLLKGIEENQFVFFTNYQSHKGAQMAHNKHIALNFYWHELQRQVRIEGEVHQISEEDSIQYFATRPIESQLGAWASHQSEALESRELLEARYQEIKKKYESAEVPKPPHWGGYAVAPTYIEFWQGRASRLHDRFCYQKAEGDTWSIQRLNP